MRQPGSRRRVDGMQAFLRSGWQTAERAGTGSAGATQTRDGQFPQPAKTAGSRPWLGGSRSARWRHGGSVGPGSLSAASIGGDHGFTAAHIVACHDVLPCGAGGELVRPGGHDRGEQPAPASRPFPLRVSRGRCRSAAPSLQSRHMFWVRCRLPVLHGGDLVRTGPIQRRRSNW
jgi:hypothetical protein